MSTNPLERIPKRSPKTSMTDLNEFAKTAGSTAASAAYPIVLGLTGEDTGDKWYVDLAYGAVPGGALVQRAKTGTIPGLLDLLPGDVGAGARLAMAPIAATFAKYALKGGKARLGKTARNLDETLDKRKYVTRYHVTSKDNVDAIYSEGLRSDTENYGLHSLGDESEPGVWLAGTGDPPVSGSQLFEVKIPRSEYFGTPKSYYSDRSHKFRRVTKPSGPPDPKSYEDGVFVEKFHKNIPPENLRLIGDRIRKPYEPYMPHDFNRLVDRLARTSDVPIETGSKLSELKEMKVPDKLEFVRLQKKFLQDVMDRLKRNDDVLEEGDRFVDLRDFGYTPEEWYAKEAARQFGGFVPYWKIGEMPYVRGGNWARKELADFLNIPSKIIRHD